MWMTTPFHGRQYGWDDSTHHSGHQVHPPQQNFLLCLFASYVDNLDIILISIFTVRQRVVTR